MSAVLHDTLVSDHEEARGRRSRLNRKWSFQRGWDDAARFQLGLPPANFGAGPKRNRDYAAGWLTCQALARATRPAAAQRGAR